MTWWNRRVRPFRRFSTQVALAAGLIAIIGIGLQAMLGYMHVKMAVQASQQRDLANEATGIARRLSAELAELAMLFSSVAREPLVESGMQDAAAAGPYLQLSTRSLAQAHHIGPAFGLYGQDGTRLAASRDEPEPLPPHLALEGLLEQGQTARRLPGSDVLWLVTPVTGLVSGRVEGAVVAAILPEPLLGGGLLAPRSVSITLLAGGQRLAQLGEAGLPRIWQEHILRVAEEGPFRGLDLAVQVVSDAGGGEAVLREQRDTTLWLLALTLAPVILLCGWMARRVTRPIAQISQAVRSVAAGEGEAALPAIALPAVRHGEIGDLVRDLDRMLGRLAALGRGLEQQVAERTRSLEAAQQALGAEAEQRRIIIDHSPYAILGLDREGRVQSCNRMAQELLGLAEAELRGRPMGELLADPAWITRQLEAPATAEDGAALPARVEELPVRRADGTLVAVECSLTPVHERGQIALLCSMVDITQRKEAERTKDEFISTVSHELRTPLTSIRGALSLVSAGKLGTIPDAAARLVGIALSNSERLVLLVNDILDLQKIESGRIQFDWTELNLTTILQRSLEANEGYAASFGIQLKLDGDLVPAPIHGDANRLMQILCNLMSNAIKFSPVGQSVELHLSLLEEEGLARIAVADRGPGIPAEFRSRIFSRFAQADGSDRRAKGGTGLGLAITKALVEHHAGSIGFAAREGGGTVFTITLPLLRPRVPQPVPVLRQGEMPRALHVDDDRDLCHVVASLLAPQVVLRSAHGMEEAQRLLAEEHFDILIIDVNLPDGNGLALSGRAGAGPRPYAIVFTRDDRPAQVPVADEWIVKDRNGAELLLQAVKQRIRRMREARSDAA
ncbi:ATP-binding protein [Pseudoroseomonas cervicalis]|uniref:ATP-binding protein n=1 Tax=Teichococcus cervicalis TaxID=204525 RepID=UPI00277EAB15|nr:hybrid sensor histidine kinase/response regulator [Pseudoroseomonas cervicalis]MDQ1078505.1 PAS domain S-box-containing protein [Pseudoroseomonas cervicalis]